MDQVPSASKEAAIARWNTRTALAQQGQEPVAFITPLMEQQMFDDWCPYKGSPDPRTVWAAATEAVNGLLLGAAPAPQAQPVAAQGEFEDLLGMYWDLAYAEGRSHGKESYGTKANRVLCKLRTLVQSTQPAQRELSDEEIRAEFSKLYPQDLGLIELAENNSDFRLDALGARHHWAAFNAGARAVLKKASEST